MGLKLFLAFVAGALVASVAVWKRPAPLPASWPAPPPVVLESAMIDTAMSESAAIPEAPIPDLPKPPRAVISRKKPAPKPFQQVALHKEAPVEQTVLTEVPLPEIAVAAPDTKLAAIGDTALPPPEPKTVTLAEGTLLQVRLGERLASDRNTSGDTFFATLDQPLVIDGWVIAERGSRVYGRITEVNQAGRVEGIASMTLELASLTTADGQKIGLRTARFVRKGDTSRKEDARKVGAATAIGAIIGAAIGGGTRGKSAVLDAETRLSFRLDRPVVITEISTERR
jgi:hypothetical protein